MYGRKRRSRDDDGELSLTPMIDVVFQLLIYFLVTFSEPERLAGLAVSRKTKAEAPPPHASAAPVIRVAVLSGDGRFAINRREVDEASLKTILASLARCSTNQRVHVESDPRAPHRALVSVLDHCAACGLRKLAVVRSRQNPH
ncbi:ExbD/TolR family protein [Kiritimatiella glycovorans]|uniref:Biopolymer transport protein ExbD n=1 Tax=Kiritimatiella glycovorans TaxID=1307763 RepID=A0A0G3EA98_9BACT|nr:biopolymer transporter ExbD [Kiritimatiella glycovorans]AKJ63366.1 biopolymer transport protein ExbD [Kiritimatiella glycovorans]